MTHIFISYSRSDAPLALRLKQSLEQLGADVWIDVEDIPAGMKWSSAIQQGLDQCDVMLVIISPTAMASTNVEDEWQYYLDQHKPIIPILFQPAKVHFQLSRIQYINFSQQPYDTALGQLHSELRRKGVELHPISSTDISVPLPAQPPLPILGEEKKSRRSLPMRLVLLVAGLALFAVIGFVIFNQPPQLQPTSTPTQLIHPTQIPTNTSVTLEPSQTPLIVSTDTPPPSLTPLGGGAGQIVFSSNNKVNVIDTNGNNLHELPTYLSSDLFPVWSPDGQHILYSAGGTLYVMDAEGRDTHQVSPTSIFSEDSAWSPDGQQIAIAVSPPNSKRDIYIINADGSNMRQITTNSAEDRHPSWSPDGQKIVFHSNRSGSYALYTADVTCGTPSACEQSILPLGSGSLVLGTFAAWSPDGTQVAFSSNLYSPSSNPESDFEIFVVNVNGSNLRQITKNGTEERRPAWSPDGTQLAFQGDTLAGDFEIFLFDFKSEIISQLTNNNASDTDPSFRPIPKT